MSDLILIVTPHVGWGRGRAGRARNLHWFARTYVPALSDISNNCSGRIVCVHARIQHAVSYLHARRKERMQQCGIAINGADLPLVASRSDSLALQAKALGGKRGVATLETPRCLNNTPRVRALFKNTLKVAESRAVVLPF